LGDRAAGATPVGRWGRWADPEGLGAGPLGRPLL